MILPSEAPPPARRWGADHDRLHRHLLRQPDLLPPGARLLVAVSGGQDSMALIGLLKDLRPLHGWRLHLWHGNHGWRDDATAQGKALAAWVGAQGLPLVVDQAEPAPPSEGAARRWRYGCLRHHAHALGCTHVLTAHTATDRAETLLLNLARGSHRRGLAALRATRPLAEGLQLVRPLLSFTRTDTDRICQRLGLPVWVDSSNTDPRFSRNRVRAEVLPVLEALHPGATVRIATLADRLAEEEDKAEELLSVALMGLEGPSTPGGGCATLARRPLAALAPANQRVLLQQWLRGHWGRSLESRTLEQLLTRLAPQRGPGRQDLAQGWHLHWDTCSLRLISPHAPSSPHGKPPKQGLA